MAMAMTPPPTTTIRNAHRIKKKEWEKWKNQKEITNKKRTKNTEKRKGTIQGENTRIHRSSRQLIVPILKHNNQMLEHPPRKDILENSWASSMLFHKSSQWIKMNKVCTGKPSVEWSENVATSLNLNSYTSLLLTKEALLGASVATEKSNTSVICKFNSKSWG